MIDFSPSTSRNQKDNKECGGGHELQRHQDAVLDLAASGLYEEYMNGIILTSNAK